MRRVVRQRRRSGTKAISRILRADLVVVETSGSCRIVISSAIPLEVPRYLDMPLYLCSFRSLLTC